MGSIEAIAAAKAELMRGLRPGGTASCPPASRCSTPICATTSTTVTFGPGGDVDALAARGLRVGAAVGHVERATCAATRSPRWRRRAPSASSPTVALDVALSGLRGQRIELAGGIVVVNDCYNANPMSMRAALDDLAASASGRRVAVLGDMLELGPDEARFHAEIGAHARAAGVDVLVAVGPARRAPGRRLRRGASPWPTRRRPPPLSRAAGARRHRAVKGSRGVGLEVVARALEGA